MKTFTIDLGSLKYIEFKSRKEWDDYMRGFSIPGTSYATPQPLNTAPDQFPCLMIYDEDYTLEHRHSADQFPNFFIYNYTPRKYDAENEEFTHLGLQAGSDTTT